MHRIAKRIENRSDLWIDGFPVYPRVAGRQRSVLGEGTVEVDANRSSVNAKMAPASQAVATSPTDHMAFAADQITDRNIGHARTELNHLTGELMAHRYWWF